MPPIKNDITAQNMEDVLRISKEIYGHFQTEKLGLFSKKSIAAKGFEGPLPDVIGYTQHGGECASDSIQEILMFADEIREYTQPIVYGLTPEQFDLRSKVTLPYNDWKRYTDYFKFLQKRFRVHYDVLNVMRKKGIKGKQYRTDHETVCQLDLLFGQKRQLSPETGILALKRLKEELVYTQSGMLDSLVYQTYTTLLQWLGIPFRVVTGLNVSEQMPLAVHMSGNQVTVRSNKEYVKPKSGHATAFLKMNGEWYHYDDNHGLMKASAGVVNALLAGKMVYVTVRRKRYFCRIEKTFNVHVTHEFPRIAYVWSDGRWENSPSALSTVLDNDGTLKRGAEIFMPSYRHILSFMSLDTVPFNNKSECVQFIDVANSLEEFNIKMAQAKECIYSNPTSNSAIFEDMYHYALVNFEFLKQSPDYLKMITLSIGSVVGRVACTPMIHAWTFHLRKKITDWKIEYGNWFEISENLPPVVYQFGPAPSSPHTPVTPDAENMEEIGKLLRLLQLDAEAKERMDKQERELIKQQKEKEEKKQPCPEGQIRDRQTRKCREKTEENIQEAEAKKEITKQKREEKKALGQNKTKRAKKEPKKPKVYVF